MSFWLSRCWGCKHYLRGDGDACLAFPAGIPDEIIHQRVEHIEPYPGQIGDYLYDPKYLGRPLPLPAKKGEPKLIEVGLRRLVRRVRKRAN